MRGASHLRRYESGLAARRATGAAAAASVATGLALCYGASGPVTALIASDAGSLVFLISVWLRIGRADASSTARMARSEDASRTAAEAVLVAAGAASLVAVGFVLAQAGRAQAPDRGLLTALAVSSVALAWFAVHTVYILRYARLYHSD